MNVGILGGGQLGRMLGLAAAPLAQRPLVWEPESSACAQIIGRHLCASYEDPQALARFAAEVDVCTFEFENVPAPVLQALATKVAIYPPLAALTTSQDRLVEKTALTERGIETAPFAAVDSLEDLRAAVAALGLPAVLKTRRFGYDGKGQFVLRESGDIDRAWAELGSAPLILEGFIRFQREVSIIAARSRSGEIVFYPLAENIHQNGILHISRARPGDPAQAQAQQFIRRLLEHLEYVGVLCLELFDLDGQLIANEFAPRVHNSGHWTIEGAETSQFENHMRAVAGLPLGAANCIGHAAMINLVGRLPPLERLLEIPDAHVHYYDKAEKPARKLGHVTVRAASAERLEHSIQRVLDVLS